MKIKTKPIIDKQQFIANPLVSEDFRILITKLRDNKSFKREDNLWIQSEFTIEKESITKVYIKSEHRLMVSNLSPNAKSLYLWIMYELDYSNDYLWINKQRYMSENHILSINTYKTAVEELSRYLFIYPSLVKEVYWINPRLFFCGNRVKKYPNNVQQE